MYLVGIVRRDPEKMDLYDEERNLQYHYVFTVVPTVIVRSLVILTLGKFLYLLGYISVSFLSTLLLRLPV